MRKTVLWALLAVLLVIGLAGQSSAAQYTCQVNAVGLENGNLYVYLTDDVAGAFVMARGFYSGRLPTMLPTIIMPPPWMP